MKTSATAKFVGTSARKTGLVAAVIRGRRALDAQTVLAHMDKRATVPVGKALASAIANAENNFNAKVKDLVIESVLIGVGPSLKRSRPRGKGSAAAILKRSSHITVVVTDGKSVATLTTDLARAALEAEAKPVKSETDGGTVARQKAGKTGPKAASKKKEAK